MALTLRVITPDRIALDKEVTSVTVPAVGGSLGILPRHAPMIAAMETGLLKYKDGGKAQVLFVSGGFTEVHGDTVRVVTEAGERPEDIDAERARAAEQRARERLAAAKEAIPGDLLDRARAEAALRRASMRLRATEYRGQ